LIPIHLYSTELSLFSLKKHSLVISIPKIWKWRYFQPTMGSYSTLFKAKSRNGHFYLGVFSDLSKETKEKLELLKSPNDLLLDLSIDEFPFLKSRKAILTKYLRKNKIGYFLQFENQNSRIYLLLEVKSSIHEKEIDFLKEIFQGIEDLDS
jgi:hypothetical protein